MNLASLRVFFCFLLGTEMFVPKRHFQLLLMPCLPLMGLNLCCQHKTSTPLYIHSVGTRLLAGRQARDSPTTHAGINSSIHMLKKSSAYSLINLQMRQLASSSPQKRKNSSTHKRTTSPKTKRTTSAKTNSKTYQFVCSPTHKLTNPKISKTQKLINSFAHQLRNSQPQNKQNSITHQLVCSSSQNLLIQKS